MKKSSKIALSAAALASVFILGACSTGTDSDSFNRVGNDTVAAETMFVEGYEYEFGPLDPSSEAALIDLGYAVCESFDSGASVDEVGQTLVAADIPEYEAGYIVGASVGSLCTEHVPTLDEWLAEDGDLWNDPVYYTNDPYESV